MTTPRFKESAYRRAERLNLGKPHVFWNKLSGSWIAVPQGGRLGRPYGKAVEFAIKQDTRWTPRMKK